MFSVISKPRKPVLTSHDKAADIKCWTVVSQILRGQDRSEVITRDRMCF